MNLYYIKSELRRYRPLGVMLSEYLNIPLSMVSENDAMGIIKKGDIVYYEFGVDNNYSEKCCLLGPDKEVLKKWNNKIIQYDLLDGVVRVPPYMLYKSVIDIIKNIVIIKSKYKKFIIFESIGESGENCLVCDEETTTTEIYNKFKSSKNRFRISKFILDTHSVSLHFIISGKERFWISPIVDQYIDNDVLFKGGGYPSTISASDKCRVIEEAGKIADFLSKDSYVGLGNIDFMVSNGDVFFTEINPRKAGTTPCMSYMMENCFNYSIPIIEYYAVREKKIPEIRQISSDMSWSLRLVDYDEWAPNSPGDERYSFMYNNPTPILYNEFYKKHSFSVGINDKV